MLPLATTTWDESEYDALQSVIKSGVFTMGERVKTFEAAFASYFGSRYAVMVNSGSSANLLAVAALFYRQQDPLKIGDEVIVPGVSWATTYTPLYQYGLKLKFVDIDRHTLNLDLEQLASAITEKTRAIFAVNLLGNPIDYQALQGIIQDKNIVLLEDNCESMGAKLTGKYTGTFGEIGTFSTFFSHHLSTMEGGMVVTDDEELYHIILSLRAHGWTRSLPLENKVCEKSDNSFDESFRFVLPGYNLRPLELSAAVGLTQLEKLPAIIEGRRRNAQVFTEIFTNKPGVMIQQEVGCSSWFGFAMIVESGKQLRDEWVRRLTAAGVECRPIVAGNFTRNPVMRYFDYTIHNSLTASDLIHDCGFFIGNHHYDISDPLYTVAKCLLQ